MTVSLVIEGRVPRPCKCEYNLRIRHMQNLHKQTHKQNMFTNIKLDCFVCSQAAHPVGTTHKDVSRNAARDHDMTESLYYKLTAI